MCNLPVLLAFCSFQGQSVPSEKQQKNVCKLCHCRSIMCQCTAWRDSGRQCAMPGLILPLPQPAAVADMHKATTYGGDHSGHEHSQVCEARLAYPSRRPGRPHRPRAEIEGAWCTGTGGKPIHTRRLERLSWRGASVLIRDCIREEGAQCQSQTGRGVRYAWGCARGGGHGKLERPGWGRFCFFWGASVGMRVSCVPPMISACAAIGCRVCHRYCHSVAILGTRSKTNPFVHMEARGCSLQATSTSRKHADSKQRRLAAVARF